MNKQIIEHLFEFWEQIGKHGGFLRNEDGFSTTYPMHNSWPSKIFGLDPNNLNTYKLQDAIRTKAAPNSIAVYEDNTTKNILESHQFISCSTIKAMALDTTGVFFDGLYDTEFKIVNTKDEAEVFAKVASESFGYLVEASTIIPLIDKPSFKIILGKHDQDFPTCGMIYIDKNGVAGIHMIGTKAGYRGMGLGKKMTRLLINQSVGAQSSKVFLVASVSGERIYTKMGFTAHGVLESYSLPLD